MKTAATAFLLTVLIGAAALTPASARVGSFGAGGGAAGRAGVGAGTAVGVGGGATVVGAAAVARPAGVGAAPVAATTAAVAYGTVVASLPTTCAQQVVGGTTYYNCGGTWYQPAFVNGAVQYTAVKPPA